MIRVLSLVENCADKAGLLGEHGLAMWVEIRGKRVLFDIGQGLALVRNAQQLGVDLTRADAVVLSHGHYDHTGGLAAALALAPSAKVFAHPQAFLRRFARYAEGKGRDVGMREPDKVAAQVSEGTETTQPVEVVPGLWATGPVPRQTDFEDASGPFFLDSACLRPDPLEDDQALFFRTEGGVAVLLGCAHAGVVNTLAYVRRLAGGAPVLAAMGGMHLRNAPKGKLEQTLAAMERMEVRRLRPCHCTGMRAVAAIWNRFPGRCGTWAAGEAAEFPEERQNGR